MQRGRHAAVQFYQVGDGDAAGKSSVRYLQRTQGKLDLLPLRVEDVAQSELLQRDGGEDLIDDRFPVEDGDGIDIRRHRHRKQISF